MHNDPQRAAGNDSSPLQSAHGPQGVDKAPGEEPAAAPDQFLQETQKGKKVDADLDNENDKPLEQE